MHSTAADIRFTNLVHLDGAHHTALTPGALEGVLQRKGVHDGGEHTHVIGLRTVHALGSTGHASEDITAAHNDANFDAVVAKIGNLVRKAVGHRRVDAVDALTHECFAG